MRRFRTLPLLLLALAAVACFEEPVREELELRFDGGARAPRLAIDLGVALMHAGGEMENRVLRNRLEGERRRLLLSEDDWTPRFERIAPAVHEVTFTREDGELSEVRQSASIDLAADPDALRRFFSDTLVDASFRTDPEEGLAELSLQPLAAGRETLRQRQLLERSIDPWTESLAAYSRAAGELYGYLDEHPERAAACYAVLFEDVLPEEERGDRGALPATERYRVEAVEDAMAAAWDVLVIGAREAHSINEISRLAYDPFPARLRIVPGGPVVAVEGFEEDGDGVFRVPSITLWDALRGLEGEWLAPDPLLTLARHGGEELGMGSGASGETPTLASILAVERYHPPAPNAAEIRGRLEGRLAPRPYYRLVWDLR